MRSKKKTPNVNATHPMLGYRVTKADKDAYMNAIKATTVLLNKRELSPHRELTRTDIFRMALTLGLAELKKKKSL